VPSSFAALFFSQEPSLSSRSYWKCDLCGKEDGETHSYESKDPPCGWDTIEINFAKRVYKSKQRYDICDECMYASFHSGNFDSGKIAFLKKLIARLFKKPT